MRRGLNDWLNKSVKWGALKNVVNVNQIPNIEFLSSNIMYVLYHMNILETSTLRQLVEVTGLTVREVRNSLKKLLSSECIVSFPSILTGNIVKIYQPTTIGKKKFNLQFGEVTEKKKMKKGEMKHSMQSGELYCHLFKEVMEINMVKEKLIRLINKDVLRTDALYRIVYTNHMNETILLEHDKGTERMERISDKLKKYSIAMRTHKITNVSFSISLEHFITKETSTKIWSNSDIIGGSKIHDNDTEHLDLIEKVCGDSLFHVLQYLAELSKKVYEEGEYNTGMFKESNSEEELKRLEEMKNSFMSYIEYYNDSLDEISITSFRQILHNTRILDKDWRYFNLANEILNKVESDHCNRIKNLILKQPDLVDIRAAELKNIPLKAYRQIVVDDYGISQVRSFKILLLNHECFVLPISEMLNYYDWKVILHNNLKNAISNYFNIDLKDYILKSDKLTINFEGVDVIKHEHAYYFEYNDQKYGFIIFDSDRLVSDQIKLDYIKKNYRNASISIKRLYFVDIKGCKWSPDSESRIKEHHANWNDRIFRL